MGGEVPIIAIDGPAASGKSTVAAQVARQLSMPWFDTGLLYRAVVRCALDRGVSVGDGAGLARCAAGLDVESLVADGDGTLQISGFDNLKAPEIDAVISQVSAHREVRNALFHKQREIAERGKLVMVGRDITTVIAPDARVKVFLDASPEVRAKRRTGDLQAAGVDVSEDEVLRDTLARDHKDSNRDLAPLTVGANVTVVNTDEKSIDQVANDIVLLWNTGNDSVHSTVSDSATRSAWEQGAVLSRRRKAVNLTVGSLLRLATRVFAEGLENVPSAGPLLFVSNHLHNTDPALEYYVYPRPLHFMGKQELFRFPIVKQIAELSGGFPVDRGKVDREALANVEKRLNRGITVGIYPEGGRSPTGALIEAKSGAGLLALKNGVPLLPVAITGSERLPFNGKKGNLQAHAGPRDPGHEGVRVVFGKPFYVPRQLADRKIRSAEATEIIMHEIARLLPVDYQGFYRESLATESKRRILPYDSSASATSSS